MTTPPPERLSPAGESKYRYRLLFPNNWQTGADQSRCPMFDKEDIKHVMKAAPELALALKINAMRIDGINPDGSTFTAATWTQQVDQDRIDELKLPEHHKGGWTRWYIL